MDPNANLKRQESIILLVETNQTETLHTLYGGETPDETREAIADELSELRQALTDWIARGGFEPDWTDAPRARVYFGR